MTAPERLRDLLVVPLGDDDCLVVACDALGAIGAKPADVVACPPEVVGRFTARVALMELLAAGARPLGVTVAACAEPEPTGASLLAGVLAEAALVGLGPDTVSGSSEKNVPTTQTGLGVTAFGRARRSALRPGSAQPGDLVLAIGRPKVGAAVGLDDPETADLPLLLTLAGSPAVHDLLPVGSRGILAEASELAAAAGLAWAPVPAPGWDLQASAGPSTCVLAAIPEANLGQLTAGLTQPWTPVARLMNR